MQFSDPEKEKKVALQKKSAFLLFLTCEAEQGGVI